mgnify:CR=1 FL=1
MLKKGRELNKVFESRLKYRQPVRKPLLLISQIQRSGGTLMSQLFDGHSQLHVHPGELNIGRPKKWHYPQVDLSMKPGKIYDLYNEERQTKEYIDDGYQKPGKSHEKPDTNSVLKSLPFLFSLELQKKLFQQFMEDFKVTDNRGMMDAYVSSYFNAWLDYQDLYKEDASVKYWCTFSARLAVVDTNVDKILHDFPQGKILTMFRNPASWYASAKKHADRYGDLEKSMNLWVKTYKTSLDYVKKYPDNVYLINFDQLLQDVPSTMKKLSEMLGIQYEEILSMPTFNRMKIASDSSFTAKIGIDKSAADRKKFLEPEQVEQVEKISKETYDRMLEESWN